MREWPAPRDRAPELRSTPSPGLARVSTGEAVGPDLATKTAALGVQLWRDPHGQIYLVDHTGSRKVTRAGSPAGAVTRHDPDIEVTALAEVIEVDPGAG